MCKIATLILKSFSELKKIAISLFYSAISGGQTGFDPLYKFVGVTHQILHCHLMPSWGCQLQGCSQSRHGREVRFASQCLVKQILAGYLGGTSKTTCNRNWFKKITGYYRDFINFWRAQILFRMLCALRTATWPCSAAKCAADKPNKRSVLSAANWLTFQATNLGLNLHNTSTV